MASSTSRPLPMQVTKTRRGTHVVHVRSFSKLRNGSDEYGSVTSPVFTIAGLDWILRYFPNADGHCDESARHVGAFVELVTKDAAAWAYVGLLILDQTTGLTKTALWERDPTLFDASGLETSNWGVSELGVRGELQESGFVRGDCLKIECVLDVCLDHLVFHDPPAPKLAPLHVDDAADLLGSMKGADVAVHVGTAAPFAAHSSVLDAYAPRFLKKHNLGRRHRPKATTTKKAMRVTIDDMPPPAVEALLQFVYTGTLPVVAGMSGAGYRDMIRRLLLAAEKYRMPRLAAICERILCNRYGVKKLKEACVKFVTDPDNYGLLSVWILLESDDL